MSDTAQGPGWWQASDGKWYAPQPPPAPAKKKSGCGTLLVVAMVVVVLIAIASSMSGDTADDNDDDGPWTGEGKNLAQRACGDATFALREFSNGTRTQESTLSELDEAADKARGAASLNAKWQPLAQAIVGSRNELATGTPATATESLIRNCGMS